jgi:8-oxo-dGTP pyrophosphatase MutT (NUDIX family)
MKIATINFPIRDGKVFLSKKKQGFGIGRLNGYGGKIEKGESETEGAIRELKEEAGISVATPSISNAMCSSSMTGMVNS